MMSKAYWSVMNTFLNNKKMPNIPALNVNGKIISNFEKKAKLFNSHVASQCTQLTTQVCFHHWNITQMDGWHLEI